MSEHRHRAQTAENYGWVTCVQPGRCDSERAHGNIVKVEVCACGHTRTSEHNAGPAVYGPWGTPESADAAPAHTGWGQPAVLPSRPE